MGVKEVGCGDMDRIEMAQDRERWWALVTALINFRIPYIVGNFLTSINRVSFSRRTLSHGVNYRVNYIRNYIYFRKACIGFVISVRPSVHIQ
jgi:hypothetical protein